MGVQRFLTILRDRWIAALVTALLVIGAVAGWTALQRPIYEASASLFVRTEPGASVADRSAGADYARQQIATYTDLADTPLVLDPAIESLGLPTSAQQVARHVSATVPQDTLLIKVTVRDSSAQGAADLADAVSASLRTEVMELESSSGVELTIVTPATVPSEPISPDVFQNLALGLVSALLAGVLAAMVRDILDNKVRKAEDIRLLTDAAIMATVPAVRAENAVTMLDDDAAQGIQAEAYRELRTNLRFLDMQGSTRSLVVTSSVKDEGKSATSINLAAAVARSGLRVLLVDGDLRNPSIHRYLGLEGGAGLTTVLIGDADLEDVVQPLDPEGLFVLASGPLPPNPNELLDSARMTQFLDAATYHYDLVILDSSPLLAAADATVLARQVSGTLFVAGSGRVRRSQLIHALQKIQLVQGRLLGIVVNGVPRSDRTAYTQVYGPSAAEQASPRDTPTARERSGPPSAEDGSTSAGARATISSSGHVVEEGTETASRSEPVLGVHAER